MCRRTAPSAPRRSRLRSTRPVTCPFRDVIEHLDFLIHIALPDDAPIALGHVAGLPAHVQVVHRHKPRLDVGSGSHFRRTSEQHSHIAGAHFGKERCLFCFGDAMRKSRKCRSTRKPANRISTRLPQSPSPPPAQALKEFFDEHMPWVEAR